MTSTLITNIGELVTCDGTGVDRLGLRHGAALVAEAGRMAWVGAAADAPAADRQIDVEGRAVLPGFVDSHSHLVFAGDRSAEFAARMTGQPYDGGGIATSVTATRAASDDELRDLLRQRIAEMRRQGTTTVEIKSGYGLTVEDEARALRLARRVHHRDHVPGRPRHPGRASGRPGRATSTWSPGRCCRPPPRTPAGSTCSASPIPRTRSPARRPARCSPPVGRPDSSCACTATSWAPAPAYNSPSSWAPRAWTTAPTSTAADIDALADAADTTVATLLPGVEFCTRSPYPDAKALLAAGVAIALATDCNPGTCYSSSMPFVIALAVRELGLTPGQAVYAATAGSARSLRRTDIGQLTVGARADLAVLDAPSHTHLAYRPGVPICRTLELDGASG